jgi:hypothetical protein
MKMGRNNEMHIALEASSRTKDFKKGQEFFL